MLDPTASRFGQAALLSGLLDEAGLRACWEALPPEKRDVAEHLDRRLARQAVQSSALTLWQAQQLLAGRTNGFKVDRYLLLELLGQGGMGRVYLARDTRLNRRVALKILAPERISNPRAVARFQREARVGAQLQHENLVRVYDFGESNGRFFLVMEYIQGKTIGGLISSKGRLPPAVAVRLTRQVALALDHAHQKKMIHRDVNPYNVMVTEEGVAKLADLGLAIELNEEAQRVTREGATVGTFDYVAPEQARHSHSADIRSDIYSLGCSLYHMLTGHVPFPSPSLPEKLFAHQAMEPEPLEKEAPGLPAGLGDVVRKMMRKQPEDRYATPMEVVQALEPYSGAVWVPGTAPSPSPSGEIPAGRGSGSHSSGAVAAAAPVALAPSVAAHDRPMSASNELDDPGVPLLTPTEEGADDFPMLDLGPEPPLREVAARSRALTGVGLSLRFRPTAQETQGQASEVAEAAPSSAPGTATLRIGHQTRPRWRVLWIPVAVATAAVAAGLMLTGRLFPPRTTTPPLTSRTTKPLPDRPDGRTHVKFEGPAIAVRGQGTTDEIVPAKNLADAIRAALGPKGRAGFVELRDHGPLSIAPGDIPDLRTGSGSLEIRAAAGDRPVIEARMEAKKSWMATGSAVSLTLSGLTIRVHPPRSANGEAVLPLLQAAGRVRLERCSFEVVGDRTIPGLRALNSEGVTVSVDRCWFRGFDEAIQVRAFDQTAAEIRQSMFVPGAGAVGSPMGPEPGRGWAIGLEILPGRASAKGPKRRLTLDHCTIEGSGLLAIDGDAGPAPMPVVVEHCAVRAGAILAWKPHKLGDRLDAVVQWKGNGNQLHVLGPSWVVMSRSAMTPELSLGAIDLSSWSNFVSREADPIRTRIHYQETKHEPGAMPRPSDFEIDSTRALDDRAGADAAVVGPWSRKE